MSVRTGSGASSVLQNVATLGRVRSAYGEDPTAELKEQYISQLGYLLDQYAESSAGGLNFQYRAPQIREDGVLEAEDVAKLMAPLHRRQFSKENLSRPYVNLAQNEERLIAEYKKEIYRNVPDLDEGFISSLEGNWKISDKEAMLLTFENTHLSKAVSRYEGVAPAAQLEYAKKSVLITVYGRVSSGTDGKRSAYREISDSNGNTIRVYAAPTGRGAVGNNEDIKFTADAFNAVREKLDIFTPLTMSIVAPSSVLADTMGTKYDSGKTVLGFAFPSGGGHVLPSRLATAWDNRARSQPDWHSINAKSLGEKSTGTSIHELGHVIAFNNWGVNPKDDGEVALARDYGVYGVRGQKVSRYGETSVHEHFAEALTKYVVTGDATPEFMDLLRSKGLLKSQEKKGTN